VIVSIGIDIVEVYRIRDTIERTPHFLDRVFTAFEKEYCHQRGKAAAESFAGRYAAKEALLKALGTGWRGDISWTDIEIGNDEHGAPSVRVERAVELKIKELGVDKIHISISHTKEHAVAQIILERLTNLDTR